METITKEEVLAQIGKIINPEEPVTHTYNKKGDHYVFAFRARINDDQLHELYEMRVQNGLIYNMGRSGYGMSLRVSFKHI